jgi:hypothetical protein
MIDLDLGVAASWVALGRWGCEWPSGARVMG